MTDARIKIIENFLNIESLRRNAEFVGIKIINNGGPHRAKKIQDALFKLGFQWKHNDSTDNPYRFLDANAFVAIHKSKKLPSGNSMELCHCTLSQFIENEICLQCVELNFGELYHLAKKVNSISKPQTVFNDRW